MVVKLLAPDLAKLYFLVRFPQKSFWIFENLPVKLIRSSISVSTDSEELKSPPNHLSVVRTCPTTSRGFVPRCRHSGLLIWSSPLIFLVLEHSPRSLKLSRFLVSKIKISHQYPRNNFVPNISLCTIFDVLGDKQKLISLERLAYD